MTSIPRRGRGKRTVGEGDLDGRSLDGEAEGPRLDRRGGALGNCVG